MNEKQQPSLYGPALVRVDQRLSYASRNFYGEITAFCNANKLCFASNGHFAELYKVSERTVSEWISQLVETGYIRLEFRKRKRFLVPCNCPESTTKKSSMIEENFHPATKNSSTILIKDYKSLSKERESAPAQAQIFIKPTLEQVKAYATENKIAVNCEKFFYHYEKTNWAKIKNWQAALHLWQAREPDFTGTSAPPPNSETSAAESAKKEKLRDELITQQIYQKALENSEFRETDKQVRNLTFEIGLRTHKGEDVTELQKQLDAAMQKRTEMLAYFSQQSKNPAVIKTHFYTKEQFNSLIDDLDAVDF